MALLYLKPKLLLCALVLIGIVGDTLVVEAQFFTKSSKSIPRMGRRSEQQLSSKYQTYRRAMVDSLVDQYWPTLLADLEVS